MPDPLDWRKSSYSGAHGGNCLEVADASTFVHVRDSQNRVTGHLTFSRADWCGLLSLVKDQGAGDVR